MDSIDFNFSAFASTHFLFIFRLFHTLDGMHLLSCVKWNDLLKDTGQNVTGNIFKNLDRLLGMLPGPSSHENVNSVDSYQMVATTGRTPRLVHTDGYCVL